MRKNQKTNLMFVNFICEKSNSKHNFNFAAETTYLTNLPRFASSRSCVLVCWFLVLIVFPRPFVLSERGSRCIAHVHVLDLLIIK